MSLINRILLLSYRRFHKENFDKILKILLSNEYSLGLIFNIIKKRLHKKFEQINQHNSDNTSKNKCKIKMQVFYYTFSLEDGKIYYTFSLYKILEKNKEIFF